VRPIVVGRAPAREEVVLCTRISITPPKGASP